MAATDIKLRERVVPRGSVVRLSDVAEIATPDRQQARQLACVAVDAGSGTGTERFLRTREIQDMLSAQGVDVGVLRFAGAAQVEIVRWRRQCEFLERRSRLAARHKLASGSHR